MLSDRVASFPMPEPDHWLPQPSVPLPGRSFLSSWARPFAQLLPRQLWGQGWPLGRDWSLLTRPDKGWVTTYKRWFLKRQRDGDFTVASPGRVVPVCPSAASSKAPPPPALSTPACELPWAQGDPHFQAPLGAQGLLEAVFSGTGRADTGAGGRVAAMAPEQDCRAGTGPSGLPTGLPTPNVQVPSARGRPQSGRGAAGTAGAGPDPRGLRA